MADVLKEFFIKLSGQTDEKSFDEMQKKVDDTAKVVKAFAIGAVTYLGASVFGQKLTEIANYFNDLGDVADRMGNTTVDALDRFSYACEMSGSDAATAQATLENLNTVIGQAAAGIGRGATVFKELGLSARNSSGELKTATEIFDEVKEKTADMTDAERAAIIQRLGMDRSMISVMKGDTAELLAEYDRRRDALLDGSEASSYADVAEMSGAFNDSLGRLSRGIQDIWTALIVRFMPAITRTFEKVSDILSQNADKVAAIFNVVGAVVSFIIDRVTNVIEMVSDVNAALDGVPGYVLLVAAAWKALNKLFAMSPIGRIIMLVMTLISVLGLLYDDFKTFTEGGQSFFDWSWAVKSLNLLVDVCSTVVTTISKLWDQLYTAVTSSALWPYLKTSVPEILGTVLDLLDGIWNGAKLILGSIVGVLTGDTAMFNEALEGLRETFSSIFGRMMKVSESFREAMSNLLEEPINRIKQGIANIGESFLQLRDDVVQWFVDGFNAIIQALGDMVGNILGALNPANLVDSAGNWAADKWDSFTNWVTGGDDTDTAAVSRVPELIPETAPQNVNNSKTMNFTQNVTVQSKEEMQMALSTGGRYARSGVY